MNPTEVYQFFTTIIRSGAEIIAAFLIGAIGATYALWQLGFLGGHRECKKELADVANKLTAEERSARRETQLKLAVAETQFMHAIEELEPLRKNHGQLQKDHEELRKKHEQSGKEIEHLLPFAARCSTLETQLAQTTTERDDAIRLKTRYLNERNTSRSQLDESKSQAAQLEGDLDKEKQKAAKFERESTAAQEQGQQFKRELDQIRDRLLAVEADNKAKDRRIADYAQANADLEHKLGLACVDAEDAKAKLAQTSAELEEARGTIFRLEDDLRSMVAQGGRIWERALPANAPPFVPLGSERTCPIISVLNLKGGVGKTTITLNLAATLSDAGKRVLMIDCDHQRSLTTLCVRPSHRDALHKNGKTLQKYLAEKNWNAVAFLDCVIDLPNMERCSLIGNTAALGGGDGLNTAEEKSLLEWLSPMRYNTDARFGLRAGLHAKEVFCRFDYILLDCPPRLSTACINALVASDHVLIPVVPDAVSATIPLPHLLRELRRLSTPQLFPQFKVLGIIANRYQTAGANLVALQQGILKDLDLLTAGAWGTPVHRFETLLKQLGAYLRAAKVLASNEDTAVAVWEDPHIKQAFTDLTKEILQRIHHETPDFATASS